MGRCNTIFAIICGIILFLMNFVIILIDNTIENWWGYFIIGFVGLIYIIFIGMAIIEPVKDLKPISREELEDHEYKRLQVDGFYKL